MNHLLLKKPHITEKAVALSHINKYVFLINKDFSAAEAKKIIEKVYSVNVVKYNVISIPGKKKRLGGKFSQSGKTKKIIVTLKDGQRIDTIPR